MQKLAIHNQKIASDPNKSVWVMASAGSGKTKILIDRILRLLLNDVAPEKIICLTYTKVAAIEMQKRLYKELQQWMVINEQQLENKLTLLTDNIPSKKTLEKARGMLIKILDSEFKIKIQTIHSFCQSILKSFPFEAKIPLNFELLEDNQSKVILKNCQKNIFHKCLFDNNLHDLVVKIHSQTSDDTLSKIINQLLNDKEKLFFLKDKFPNIENLELYLFNKFNIKYDENNPNILNQQFTNFLDNLKLDELKKFSYALENSSIRDKNNNENILKFIANPLLENFNYLFSGFFTEKNELRVFSKKILETFSTKINEFAHLIYNFDQLNIALTTIDKSLNLVKIVDVILEEFNNFKRQHGYLDYSDLINITDKMLKNPDFCDWIKLKMDSSFNHILIDEAQDTNPIQWSIIKSLTEDFFSGATMINDNKTIFIVGDEKQSIMGFQGADIQNTKDIHQYFLYKSSQQLQDVDLNISFRSGKNILLLVDKIFQNQQLQNAVCKIGAYRPHLSFRNTNALVEIWQNDEIMQKFKDRDKLSAANDDLFNLQDDALDFKDIIAKYCAYTIKNWVANQRLICDIKRPVNYGDIMILVRSKQNGLIEKLNYYFDKLNIPFTSVGKIKFSENLLINDFISLAKFALLPSDCFNLACLLKSPFFNCQEEELFNLCLHKNNHKITLWQAVQEHSNFKNALQNILDLSHRCNLFDFFFILLKDDVNHHNIISRFSLQADEIIDNFLFICQDYYLKQSPHLQNFLEFIEKIDPEFNIDNIGDNQLKISTIHSSKGLQAPIVIIPDCLYNYQKQPDSNFKILWDENIPIWLNSESKTNQIIKKIYDDKVSQNYEEHLRLLYVALTRAEDELYIGGLGNDKDVKSWYEIINSIKDDNFNYRQIQDIAISLPQDKASPQINKNYLSNSKFDFSQFFPAQNFDQISEALIFGKNLHHALNIIGKNSTMPKDWIIEHISNSFANSYLLNVENYQKLISSVRNFIESTLYFEIFQRDKNAKIFSEYEVYFKDKIYRLDLIKITNDKIIIYDYKSDDKKDSTIPQNYRDQLNNYAQAIKYYHGDKIIQTAIIWIKDISISYLSEL